MDWKEIIGISASVLILISMLFKTSSVKGRILMRSLNIAGSVVFTIYGFLLPAWSTAVLNALLVFVNAYHLITILHRRKKRISKENLKKETQNISENEENAE